MRKKYKSKTYKVRNKIASFFVRIIAACVWILPYKIMRVWANLLGRIIWFFVPNIRHVSLSNLSITFPEKSFAENTKIGKKALINLMQTALELFWFSNSQKRVKKYFRYSPTDIQLLEDALTENRGIFLCSPHLGNWEIGTNFVTQNFGEMTAIAKDFKNSGIDKIVIENRRKNGTKIVKTKDAAKNILLALKRNEVIGLLSDQNIPPEKGGIFTPFLGLMVPISQIAEIFHRKMHSPIFIARCLHTKDGFDFYVERLDNLNFEQNGAITEKIMAKYEEFIRKNPEQYLWNYRMFRNIPENASVEERQKYPIYKDS